MPVTYSSNAAEASNPKLGKIACERGNLQHRQQCAQHNQPTNLAWIILKDDSFFLKKAIADCSPINSILFYLLYLHSDKNGTNILACILNPYKKIFRPSRRNASSSMISVLSQCMEDETIIGLYNDRYETAIAQIDQKYGGYCRAFSYNILQNRPDTEECVNDAYLYTWNAIPSERPRV